MGLEASAVTCCCYSLPVLGQCQYKVVSQIRVAAVHGCAVPRNP